MEIKTLVMEFKINVADLTAEQIEEFKEAFLNHQGTILYENPKDDTDDLIEKAIIYGYECCACEDYIYNDPKKYVEDFKKRHIH
jgi:hypothetical protein